jgi:hypothetical protein
VIVGLPESPVKDVVLKNVDIQATKGLQIAYAEVSASDLKVMATDGQSITVAPNAKLTIK